MATELQQIRKRLNARKALDDADRNRQRELVLQRVAEGATWSEIQEEAGISRMTISAYVHGPRPRKSRAVAKG